MTVYDKPTWQLIKEALDQLPERFTTDDVLAWFRSKYPKLKRSGIRTHIVGMSVNHPSRHHYPALLRHGLLYKLDRHHYARYDPGRHGLQQGAHPPRPHRRNAFTVAKCASLAKKVLTRLATLGASSQDLASRFKFEGGDMPDYTGRRTISKLELVVIGEWKMARRPGLIPRIVGLIQQNEPGEIQAATSSALALADRWEVARAVQELKRLKGVGVAVASTILTACRPNRYGIIDRLVCQSLKELVGGPFQAGLKSRLTPRLYQCYVELLAELSKQTGMTARDWDKALWQMQQEKRWNGQEGRSTR